eukprot:TRINITY_DN7120_c0_g1_i1.p2 TRINITY_DN7120_c0_g1~~TRINITY_DN7120_c0_g1_i1.p2  ORF type:complete len:198 (-),score=67.21 TRINITY_DN7120_c0_g1_i1:134-727(-)
MLRSTVLLSLVFVACASAAQYGRYTVYNGDCTESNIISQAVFTVPTSGRCASQTCANAVTVECSDSKFDFQDFHDDDTYDLYSDDACTVKNGENKYVDEDRYMSQETCDPADDCCEYTVQGQFYKYKCDKTDDNNYDKYVCTDDGCDHCEMIGVVRGCQAVIDTGSMQVFEMRACNSAASVVASLAVCVAALFAALF